ncbi:MAG: cupin domain-containing protein, partial [Nitrospinota bacterium]
DKAYEPPLKIRWGVNSHTTGTQTITTGRTIIPPKGRNQRHYHVCDATFYVVRGPIIVWMGEEKEEHLVPEGHFVYVAAGEIHGLLNPNDTDAELIFTYGNCPNRDAAKTIYVEDVWQPAEAD